MSPTLLRTQHRADPSLLCSVDVLAAAGDGDKWCEQLHPSWVFVCWAHPTGRAVRSSLLCSLHPGSVPGQSLSSLCAPCSRVPPAFPAASLCSVLLQCLPTLCCSLLASVPWCLCCVLSSEIIPPLLSRVFQTISCSRSRNF